MMAATLGVEDVVTAKLDNDSPSQSQIEQEELEVNLHIEGSGKRVLKRRASSGWGEGSRDFLSRKRLKDEHLDRKSTRLNSSHYSRSRMPSSA